MLPRLEASAGDDLIDDRHEALIDLTDVDRGDAVPDPDLPRQTRLFLLAIRVHVPTSVSTNRRVAIDPDDTAGQSDHLGDEHRHIARAAAEIEDLHARCDPGCRKHLPRRAFEEYGLVLQPPFIVRLRTYGIAPHSRHIKPGHHALSRFPCVP